MIRHIALFRWAEGGGGEDDQAAVIAALTGLPAQIPEILGYHFGPDAGIDDGNWDFAVAADVADEAAYAVYRDHPAHRAVLVDVIRPRIAARAAVQYHLDD